jgi:hypothetical protein
MLARAAVKSDFVFQEVYLVDTLYMCENNFNFSALRISQAHRGMRALSSKILFSETINAIKAVVQRALCCS